MNNLRRFRELANIEPKMLSKLINDTVYAYLAYERERLTPTEETKVLLSLLYKVDISEIFSSTQCKDDTMERLSALSDLNDVQKLEYLMSGVFEPGVKPTSANVRKIKNNIKQKNCENKT